MDRRQLLGIGVSISALATVKRSFAGSSGPYSESFDLLDRYIERYLTDMNAPGLTLCLADAHGVQRVCAYGLDDLNRRTPLNQDSLFHIGSITKSFLALCLLQLCDEGKLDLHRPIQDYLPWLRFDAATRPLTSHDLLTHSAALPDGPLFPAESTFRYRPTAAPGKFFHYCNMGYQALGLLLETLDGQPLEAAFRARILQPLGMTATEPVISLDMFSRTATSYQADYSDRPYPRQGPLARSPPIAMVEASGCIASSALDMGAYLTMLINRGATPSGRIVSPAAFELFAHPYIPAKEFGPDSSYGYGIAIDHLDGNTRLKHTGGMVSFASALQVDRGAGVGAFASINAMQGYRPTAVAEYALRLMRACLAGAALPDPPARNPAVQVPQAAEYSGRYRGHAGRDLVIVAEGDRLYVMHGAGRVPLEPAIEPDDAFIAPHPDFARYALLFRRGEKGAFVELGWGEEWFVTEGYQGPRSFMDPDQWARLTGHYRNEDPWIGSARIVLRGGRLWLNGVVPLEHAPNGRFYLRNELDSPEWVSFSDFVNGRPMRMRLSGADLARV